MKKAAIAVLLTPAVLGAVAYKDTKRLGQTTTVLREMSHASDRGVPQDLSRKAHCIVIVPGLKKVAFIGGGKYGRGYASCITPRGLWSSPAAVRIEGGSFGLQLGGSETDVILLVMNDGGMQKLTSDKFTLGGEANAAAGPLGRNLSANTDVLMKAEILTYSRSRGVFAGLSLEGATLRPDKDENIKLYGRELSQAEILSGSVAQPQAATALMRQIQTFSGKGAPGQLRRQRGRSSTARAGTSQFGSNSASVASNRGDANISDLEIEREIRQSLVADKSLSSDAHNVKIVSMSGSVMLRGLVRSNEEKAAIAAKAASVVSAERITNKIDVASRK